MSSIELTTAFIGLGSNLADPVMHIKSARTAIARLGHVQELNFSGLYKSAPMGSQDQPDYINAVMAIKTTLTPLDLLHALQLIETEHGRKRGVQRWGARTLDLDLLLYGDEKINTPELTVPHYGIAERAFVLYPLSECAPDLEIPGHGKFVDLLHNCPPSGLQRLDEDATNCQ